ncbi:acyltransferase domain-containing protein [Chloroflexi bacterium TSY]|nr:acyltransferase domain-containing protein [Chloroflexi bacterium TSY]
MSKKNVFMFSGQGAQYYQMGRGLYEHDEHFRRWLNEFDRLARTLTGCSIVDVMYAEDKKVFEEFSQTCHTHPAIFMVESALAFTLIDHGIKPDVVVGASLGEFAAAAVAGILSHEQALELVIQQADSIERACEPGQVLAVFAQPDLLNEAEMLRAKCELVAVNGDTHFVIAGSAKNCADMGHCLREKGVMFQNLPVSHGFHSSNIDPAFPVFRARLETATIYRPQIPFISSLYGKEVTEVQHEYFWQIVRQPIQIQNALAYLNRSGGHDTYIDLGPTGTLANFTKRYYNGTTADLAIFPIMTQYRNEVENIEKVKRQIPVRPDKHHAKARHILAQKSFVPDLPKRRWDKTFLGDRRIAYIFPGQGSQKKGMGEGLFATYKELVEEADAILGYSVTDLCLRNNENRLNQTQFTQPALYVVNALSYLDQLDKDGITPEYVAGHSLSRSKFQVLRENSG